MELDKEKILSLERGELDALFRQFIFKIVRHPEEAVFSVDTFYALVGNPSFIYIPENLRRKALIEMMKALPEKKGEEVIEYLCSHNKWNFVKGCAGKICQKKPHFAKIVFNHLLLEVDLLKFGSCQADFLKLMAKANDQDSLWMWQQVQNKFPNENFYYLDLSELYAKKTVLRPLLWEKIKSPEYGSERALFDLMKSVAEEDPSKADECLKFVKERIRDAQIYIDGKDLLFSIIVAVAKADSSKSPQCLTLIKEVIKNYDVSDKSFFRIVGEFVKADPSQVDEGLKLIRQRADSRREVERDFFEVVGCVAEVAPHKAEGCLNLISENVKKVKTSVEGAIDVGAHPIKSEEYERQATLHLRAAYDALEIIRGAHPDKSKADAVFEELMENPSNSEFSIKYAKIKMGRLPVTSARIGKKTKKDEKNPFGFEQVEAIDPDEPCVLCLGGAGVNKEKVANGYLSIIRNLLENCNFYKKVKLYSAVYDFDFFNENTCQEVFSVGEPLIDKYYKKKDRLKVEKNDQPPHFVQKIFDKAFLHRICDEKGERLSLEEACKKMRKITVVAHCLGAGVFIKLEELMQHKMKELGYSSQEQKLLQHELLCIADAPLAPLGISNSTMISFISQRDGRLYRAFRDSNFAKEMSMFANFAEKKKKQFFGYFPKEKGELILVSSYTKDKYAYQHDFFNYDFMQRGLNFKGRFFVLMRANALINGIKNSLSGERLPSVKDLVCGKNLIFRKVFDKIKQNGVTMWNEIVKKSTERLKEDRMLKVQR